MSILGGRGGEEDDISWGGGVSILGGRGGRGELSWEGGVSIISSGGSVLSIMSEGESPTS